MQNPIKSLQKLFVEGGVEIVTPGVARTFIQPDADIIHYIDRDVLSHPDPANTMKPHFEKIDEFLSSLKKSRLIFDWFFPALSALILAWTGVELIQNSGALNFGLILQFVFGLLSPFAKSGIIWGLKRVVSGKLSRLMPEAT